MNEDKMYMEISEEYTLNLMRKLDGSTIHDRFKEYYPESFTGSICFSGETDIDTMTFLSPTTVNHLVWPTINALNNSYIVSEEAMKTELKDISDSQKVETSIPPTNEGIVNILTISLNNVIQEYLKDENQYKNLIEEIKRIKLVTIKLKSLNYFAGTHEYSMTTSLSIEKNESDK